MRTRITLFSACLLGLSAPGVGAQDAERSPAWFTVELVVFEHGAGRDDGAPPPDTHAPRLDGAVRLEEVFEQIAGRVPDRPPEATPGAGAPLLSPMYGRESAALLPDFLPVPDDERVLVGARARLERAAGYRPLAYLAWRQRAVPVGGSQRVLVVGGRVLGHRDPRTAGNRPATLGLPAGIAEASEPEPLHELEGTAALVQGRFRHLDLDLVLRRPQQTAPFRIAADAEAGGFPAWRLRERRRVRAGEWHYFDHRDFGALALVRPWTAPDDDSGEDEPGIAAREG